MGMIAAKLAAQPPFATTGSQSTNLDDPLTLKRIPHSTLDDHQHLGHQQELQTGLRTDLELRRQQTLPSNTIVELEYIGTKGTGLGVQMAPKPGVAGSRSAAERN